MCGPIYNTRGEKGRLAEGYLRPPLAVPGRTVDEKDDQQYWPPFTASKIGAAEIMLDFIRHLNLHNHSPIGHKSFNFALIRILFILFAFVSTSLARSPFSFIYIRVFSSLYIFYLFFLLLLFALVFVVYFWLFLFFCLFFIFFKELLLGIFLSMVSFH